MAKRYVLKYSDSFEDMKMWQQFCAVIEGTHGRRNLLIFRIVSALIIGLGISECDEYTMITVIERWACEMLSGSRVLPGFSTAKTPVSDSIAAVPVTEPAIRSPDAPKKNQREVSPAKPSGNEGGISFDMSVFSGMNRSTSLSDI